MKYCSKCNIYFSRDGNFCKRCGSPLSEKKLSFCPECGEKLQDGALFCRSCGTSINAFASSRKSVPSSGNNAQNVGTGSVIAGRISQNSGRAPVAAKRDIRDIPKLALIGVIVLAIALLGGGGYYFLTHNDKTASKLQPKSGITSIIKDGNIKDGNNKTSSGTIKDGNIKDGNNKTSSGKNIAGNAGNTAGNAVQAQPIRPGVISKAYHSSADKEGSYIHSADLAVDGNPASCWSEGVSGLGIGENIVIHFNGTYKVSGMDIWIGHQKSQSLFYQNARPGSICVEGADGTSEVYALRDTFGAQRVDFKTPINTNFIKIIVDQSVPGNKYQDTCIAEVSFF